MNCASLWIYLWAFSWCGRALFCRPCHIRAGSLRFHKQASCKKQGSKQHFSMIPPDTPSHLQHLDSCLWLPHGCEIYYNINPFLLSCFWSMSFCRNRRANLEIGIKFVLDIGWFIALQKVTELNKYLEHLYYQMRRESLNDHQVGWEAKRWTGKHWLNCFPFIACFQNGNLHQLCLAAAPQAYTAHTDNQVYCGCNYY